MNRSAPTSALYHTLDRLARTATLHRFVSVLALQCGVVAMGLALLTGSFALYPWIVLPWLFTGLLAGAAAVFTGTAIVLLWPLRWRRYRAALAVDARGGNAHPCVALALELDRAGRADASETLIEENMKRALEQLHTFPPSLRGVITRWHLYCCAIGVIFFTLSLLPRSPALPAYWSYPFAALRPARFRVEPGSRFVPRGDSLVVSLRPLSGTHPLARLEYGPLERGRGRSLLLRPDNSGVFSFTLEGVQASVVYRFTPGARPLPPDTIHVVEPPTLTRLALEVTPPPYTGRTAVDLPPGVGSSAVYAGSRIRYSLEASFPLARAQVATEAGDTVELEVQGSTAQGELGVRRSTVYRIVLQDTLGQKGGGATPYALTVIADEKPLVRILRPGRSALLAPEQLEEVVVEGVDDLGVHAMGLQWYTSVQDSVHSKAFAIGEPSPALLVRTEWDLVPLGLYPGDTVFYWAWAQDGRGVAGRSVSDTNWLRFPGFAERHEMLARGGEALYEQLQGVRDRQGTLSQSLQEAVRRTETGQHMDWGERRRAGEAQRELAQQRDSLAQAVEALQDAVEHLTRQEGYDAQELLYRMDAIQAALMELMEQYGDSLLEQMQGDDREPSANQLREALDAMTRMLPEMERQLDRALQFLEELKRDQRRLSLARRMEELGVRQRELTGEESGAHERRRQERVLDDAAALSKLIRDAMDPSQGAQPLFMPEDVPALDQVDALGDSMRGELSRGDFPPSRLQERLGALMMGAGEQMRSSMSSALAQRMKRERELLGTLAADALTLAHWQRATDRERLQQGRMHAAAVQHSLLEGVRSIQERIDSLGMVAPGELGEISSNVEGAQTAMEQALGRLDASGFGPFMEQAAVHLVAAAQTMLRTSQNMMGGEGGQEGGGGMGGLAGMLRHLATQQGAINAATAGMLRRMLEQSGSAPAGSGAGDRGSETGEGSAEGARAREQARAAQHELARRLKELAHQGAGAAGQKRLQELEQEARRLEKMLAHPDHELIERQERFLSRLLQSALSVHREGEGDRERRGERAVRDFSDGSLPALPAGYDRRDEYEVLRLRAAGANVPPAYLRSVKEYFDALGERMLDDRP